MLYIATLSANERAMPACTCKYCCFACIFNKHAVCVVFFQGNVLHKLEVRWASWWDKSVGKARKLWRERAHGKRSSSAGDSVANLASGQCAITRLLGPLHHMLRSLVPQHWCLGTAQNPSVQASLSVHHQSPSIDSCADCRIYIL